MKKAFLLSCMLTILVNIPSVVLIASEIAKDEGPGILINLWLAFLILCIVFLLRFELGRKAFVFISGISVLFSLFGLIFGPHRFWNLLWLISLSFLSTFLVWNLRARYLFYVQSFFKRSSLHNKNACVKCSLPVSSSGNCTNSCLLGVTDYMSFAKDWGLLCPIHAGQFVDIVLREKLVSKEHIIDAGARATLLMAEKIDYDHLYELAQKTSVISPQKSAVRPTYFSAKDQKYKLCTNCNQKNNPNFKRCWKCNVEFVG